jgi:hypothetical protein
MFTLGGAIDEEQDQEMFDGGSITL